MRNPSKLRVCSFLFLVLLASCDSDGPKKKTGEWPPLANWAKENFEENRASLELLESMLEETSYTEVHRSVGGSAMGRTQSEDSYDEVELADGSKWSKLLAESFVFSVVAAEDGYTGYPTGMNPFWDENDYQRVDGHVELIGTLTYIHSPFADDQTPNCKKEQSVSRCGRCVIELAPQWYAFFTWAGSELLPDSAELGAPAEASDPYSEAGPDSKLETCLREWDALTQRLADS